MRYATRHSCMCVWTRIWAHRCLISATRLRLCACIRKWVFVFDQCKTLREKKLKKIRFRYKFEWIKCYCWKSILHNAIECQYEFDCKMVDSFQVNNISPRTFQVKHGICQSIPIKIDTNSMIPCYQMLVRIDIHTFLSSNKHTHTSTLKNDTELAKKTTFFFSIAAIDEVVNIIDYTRFVVLIVIVVVVTVILFDIFSSSFFSRWKILPRNYGSPPFTVVFPFACINSSISYGYHLSLIHLMNRN